ncbi:MAG TPA: response regulator [Polyangiaceae bacterium]
MNEPTQQTVLIVDDDRNFCAALAAALRRRGFASAVACDYDEALVEAEAWEPSKAVVDLRMPGKGGLDLVQALRSKFPEIQVVVLTGFGSIATAVEAIKLGAQHYLTKPASVDEILAAFERTTRNPDVTPPDEPMPLEDREREHIDHALNEAGGNVSEAARRLGIHRRTLQRKLARWRPS